MPRRHHGGLNLARLCVQALVCVVIILAYVIWLGVGLGDYIARSEEPTTRLWDGIGRLQRLNIVGDDFGFLLRTVLPRLPVVAPDGRRIELAPPTTPPSARALLQLTSRR